jgi:hypothetical protein
MDSQSIVDREHSQPQARREVTTQVSSTHTFASVDEALELVEAAMSYVAAADPTELPAEVQARSLIRLERVHGIETAARTSILGAFTAGRGYTADAAYSTRGWLMNQTQVTKATATGHCAWTGRSGAHPRVMAALAAGEVSESFGRMLCTWTDQLPEECRDEADRILLDAVRSGMDVRDLAALFAEMLVKSRSAVPGDGGEDPGQVLDDRSVRLEKTFEDAGVLTGDLTPECTAVVAAVLDALSAPADAEDTRTHGQRYHDALLEAMRRLVAADLLPERAGQPARVWAHISLADLIVLDADSALQDEWIAEVRVRWAAARAASSAGGGDGAAWLDGAAAEGFACDASVTPVVTGDVNVAALDDLVGLCVELAGHGHGRCGPSRCGPGPGGDGASGDEAGGDEAGGDEAGGDEGSAGHGEEPAGPARPTDRGREALEQAIIGKAVELLSGRGGLASFLRRRELGARLGGPSLPLDIGYSRDIPASIRNAVRLRDRHCRWPGGCNQPAVACEVHHVRHKANGGQTSLRNCILLCFYHHQVMIHRQGWTLVLNPDGTTVAWNREQTKVLRSHGPPARAG